jgi:hypothetical protein
MDVSEQFNKFAGLEVAVTEKPYKHTFRSGRTVEGVSVVLDENDPVVKELNDAVAAAGLHLRLWLPDTMGTCDMNMSRVNAYVEKEADGKYRLQPKFSIG